MEETKFNNGTTIDSANIKKSDYKIAAKEWAEGNKNLEELLLYCLENDIKTRASCNGESEEDKRAYISFEFNEKNLEAIKKVITKINMVNNTTIEFVNNIGVYSYVTIRMPMEKSEKTFNEIREILKIDKNVNEHEISNQMKAMISLMSNKEICNNSDFRLEYSIENNKEIYYLAAQYINQRENYINNGTTPLDTAYIRTNPNNVESILVALEEEFKLCVQNKEQNISRKIQDDCILKNINDYEDVYLIDVNALIENEDYIKNGINVVKPILDTTIEEFAKSIEGKKIVGNFNGFFIDAQKYSSAQDIINSYLQYKKEQKTNEIGREEIEDVTRNVEMHELEDVFAEIEEYINGKQADKVLGD